MYRNVHLNEAKREEQQRQIIELYLKGMTQEEVGQKLGVSHQTVGRIVQDFRNELLDKPVVPESLQLYNVWNFSNRDHKIVWSYSRLSRCNEI